MEPHHDERPNRSGSLRRLLVAGASLLALAAAGASAQAQSISDALQQTQVSGLAGVYNFDYGRRVHGYKFTRAFAAGGDINVYTGAIDGFSVGLSGYTAQSLGLYTRSGTMDTELAGRRHGIQSVRQAYLQYQTSKFVIRFGRQFLSTPYAARNQYTLIPRSFMGVSGKVDVIGDTGPGVDTHAMGPYKDTSELSVYAARIFTYSSRYSDGFANSNRYSPGPVNGFITVGSQFVKNMYGNDVTAQLWYYDFYQTAALVFGQASLTRPLGNGNALIGGVEFVSEGSSGSGQQVFGPIDAHVYGAKLGLTLPYGTIALIGNYSPAGAYNSFRHGGMVHPYSDDSGRLYTDTMENTISNMGPGYAFGVTGGTKLLNDKLGLTSDFVHYVARYGYGGSAYSYGGAYGFPVGPAVHDQGINAFDFDVSYSLSSVLKGLSVEDDTDTATAENVAGSGTQFYNPYFSNRFYLRYAF